MHVNGAPLHGSETEAAAPGQTSHKLASSTSSFAAPSSILIVGAGVFGLSTALALTRRTQIPSTTKITVLDRSPEPGVFPARDASSIDTSRIIRADYADPAYAVLCAEAQREWRKQGDDELGGQGRYTENGLILVADQPYGTSEEDAVHTAEASTIDPADKGKKDGMYYVQASWENLQELASEPGSPYAGKIKKLPSSSEISSALGLGEGSGTGDWGYLNASSGWADADASMKFLYNQVVATNRVTFINGTASSLLVTDSTVRGVTLDDGSTLTADLTVLTTGSWTASLVDMQGKAMATGQVMGYMEITDEEQRRLENMPTILNLTSGYFVFPPSKKVLKVARHAYGYVNPQDVPYITKDQSLGEQEKVSLPWTHLTTPTTSSPSSLSSLSHDSIPSSASTGLHSALTSILPLPSLRSRPFTSTRMCWYSDTPTGDFLIDYHPSFHPSPSSPSGSRMCSLRGSLLVATGCSGHAFKFLPVLGERIVDRMMGVLGEEFTEKWAWKTDGQSGEGESGRVDGMRMVITEDGSRGGKPGETLKHAFAQKVENGKTT